MGGGLNPMNLVNGAINTVTDLASGNISKAGQDFLGTATQALPLIAPGIGSLAASALGGGLASSILGAASGGPSIASGLTSMLPGLGGILGGMFGGGTSGAGGSGSGTGAPGLDGSTLSGLKNQFSDQLNFQKQFDQIAEAANKAFALESARHDFADKVFGALKV